MRTVICGNIVDALLFLSKTFPLNFLPDKIRITDKVRFDPVPPMNAFWDTIRKIDETSRSGNPSEPTKSLTAIKNLVPGKLETSPFAFLLKYCSTVIIRENPSLLDKNLKILQALAQIIPSNSEPKLDEEGKKWLTENLNKFTMVYIS